MLIRRSLLFLILGLATLFTVNIVHAQQDNPFDVEVVASFDEPWALEFLPDGRMLVTEKKGSLYIISQTGEKSGPVSGVPDVDYGGQGGLGDVLLHPDFGSNGQVYLSYVEAGMEDTRGAAVARATLDTEGRRPELTDVEVIWRQYPKYVGYGHYGHRLMFDADGYLWLTSGERQKFTPAQDMQSNSGKILRLTEDGETPSDNPFVDYIEENPLVDDIGVYDQVWSLGHRNPLGIVTDSNDRVWAIEMGPAGGDELNLIQRGGNYGYPQVSNGDHYDGRDMPDHDTRPDDFIAPVISWTPVISPGDMMIYQGDQFADWQGDALVPGLSSQALIRIELEGENASEAARYPMGARLRSIAEGPDGAIWILEDERRDSQGRLLKLTPPSN